MRLISLADYLKYNGNIGKYINKFPEKYRNQVICIKQVLHTKTGHTFVVISVNGKDVEGEIFGVDFTEEEINNFNFRDINIEV